MAPDPIWHQGCKGVNLAPSSSFVSGDPYEPNESGNSFPMDFYFQHQIRGLFGFVLRGRVKIFNTGLFLPTFEEGTVCFCVWGPLRAQKRGKHLQRVLCATFSILDLYCQNLRRVLFLSCLGALTGPGEFLLYHVQSNEICSICMVPN